MQKVLQQAANSIGLDVLFLLINNAFFMGYYESFSIRALVAETGRSHPQVAKKVRQLEELELVQLNKEKSPGKSLNVVLQPQAPVNRLLMRNIIEEIEKWPIIQVPKHIQQELVALRRENRDLRTKNSRMQVVVEKMVKRRATELYRVGFDFAHIGNKAAHRFEEELPNLRNKEDVSLVHLMETLVVEAGQEELEEYLQTLWEG